MRMRFRQEEFPTREQILEYSERSKYETGILIATSIYYNTFYTIATTYGFNLVRFQFEEMEIIIHKQPMFNWVIEFNVYEKRNKD